MTNLIIKKQAQQICQENDDWMVCKEDEFVGWLQETSIVSQQTNPENNVLIEEDKWLSIKSCFKVEAGLSQRQREELWNMLNKHSQAFSFSKGDLGYCTMYEHEIDTQGFYPCRSPPNRFSEYEEEEVHRKIIGLCAIGKMRPNKSKYAAKVTLSPKEDGNRRFCGDYRLLNMQTRKDSFPMPLISDVINQLGRSE